MRSRGFQTSLAVCKPNQPCPALPSATCLHDSSSPACLGEQGVSLLLIGPFLDRYMSAAWVFHWSYTTNALAMLAVSCVCAVGVNISQFACLGRFSAVSFQVLLHATLKSQWQLLYGCLGGEFVFQTSAHSAPTS